MLFCLECSYFQYHIVIVNQAQLFRWNNSHLPFRQKEFNMSEINTPATRRAAVRAALNLSPDSWQKQLLESISEVQKSILNSAPAPTKMDVWKIIKSIEDMKLNAFHVLKDGV